MPSPPPPGTLSFDHAVPLDFNRRRKGRRGGAGVGHRVRATFTPGTAVHVVLVANPDARDLDRDRCAAVIRGAFLERNEVEGARVLHMFVERDRVHAIVEADEASALARTVQGLAIRMARRLNKRMKRRGKLWAARFDSSVLRTPAEVASTIGYLGQKARRVTDEKA